MSRPSRGTFLGTLGAAAVALPELGVAPALAAGQAPPVYDLLIRGGRVIDASQQLSGDRDVAIANGSIAAVAANIPANQARQVLDARGKLVTPGLINTHR